MRKRHRRISIRRGYAPLRLTSMMDILTVLLLFLLKSFVVEGAAMTPIPGVNLPESTSEGAPQVSVIVAIFDDAVMIDGEVVASVSKAVRSDDLLIDGLADRLEDARDRAVEIARHRGSEEEFKGRVSVQGDREINFEILQRVMYTCSVSGFENISLAVIGT